MNNKIKTAVLLGLVFDLLSMCKVAKVVLQERDKQLDWTGGKSPTTIDIEKTIARVEEVLKLGKVQR